MPVFLNVLLCAIVGAIAAHVAYVQSNLFIQQGDPIRRGYHPLFDPLAFDLMGLVWGVVVGGICAAWLRGAAPWKPVLAGVVLTLVGVAVVGSGTTWSRYRELPVEPLLARQDLVLEFDVRLPVGRAATGQFYVRTTMGSGVRNTVNLELFRNNMQTNDGRITLPGRVQLRQADSRRLISVALGNGDEANFVLPLAAVPTTADAAWTDWITAVNYERESSPAQAYHIRYRVRFGPER